MDQEAPVAPKKPSVQFLFQIFNPASQIAMRIIWTTSPFILQPIRKLPLFLPFFCLLKRRMNSFAVKCLLNAAECKSPGGFLDATLIQK